MRKLALWAIRMYQASLSPYLGGSCRFSPSCSSYTHQAISAHGVGRGVWLGARRLARCRPLGGQGYDPVPFP
jgi:putative membrane protein insertion efficiency factor